MKKLVKLLTLIVSIAFAISMVACGDSEKDGNSGSLSAVDNVYDAVEILAEAGYHVEDVSVGELAKEEFDMWEEGVVAYLEAWKDNYMGDEIEVWWFDTKGYAQNVYDTIQEYYIEDFDGILKISGKCMYRGTENAIKTFEGGKVVESEADKMIGRYEFIYAISEGEKYYVGNYIEGLGDFLEPRELSLEPYANFYMYSNDTYINQGTWFVENGVLTLAYEYSDITDNCQVDGDKIIFTVNGVELVYEKTK